MTSRDVKGPQPEALETFDAAARRKGMKPRDIGLEATAETAPRRDDPASKDRTAARILKEGATGEARAQGETARSRKDPRTD